MSQLVGWMSSARVAAIEPRPATTPTRGQRPRLRRTPSPVVVVEVVLEVLVDVLVARDIPAVADREAHGVYVGGRKIASLGLRIRKGCSYHGFALNVDMDLAPFSRINPCGYAGLQMTQLHDFLRGETPSLDTIGTEVAAALQERVEGRRLG